MFARESNFSFREVLGGFDWDEDAVAFEGVGDEATAKATASKELEVLGGKEYT